MTKTNPLNRFLYENPIAIIRKHLKFTMVFNGPISKEKGRKPITDSIVSTFEADPSVKIYRTKENKQNILALSKNGLRLFMYILMGIRKGKDTIRLVQLDIMKELDISRNTYYRVQSELISNGFIYRETGMSTGLYYINPHIFFAGNLIESMEKKYTDKTDVIFDVIHTIAE